MKTLMITLMLLLGTTVLAHEEVVPDYLKDGMITVTLKSGKQYTFSTNEYKVVKRGHEHAAPALVQAEPAAKPSKVRLRIMGGTGPSGELNVTKTNTSATIKTDNDAVGAFGLDVSVGKGWSINGQVQTNSSGFLGLGLDL